MHSKYQIELSNKENGLTFTITSRNGMIWEGYADLTKEVPVKDDPVRKGAGFIQTPFNMIKGGGTPMPSKVKARLEYKLSRFLNKAMRNFISEYYKSLNV